MQVRFLPGASDPCQSGVRVRSCSPPPVLPSGHSVAESTLDAPTIPAPAAADQTVAGEPAPWTLRAYTSEHPWLSVSAVILVISALLTVWARTRPSYDAYGWMVWGHQTWRLTLDLGGAPSWKPVPFLFTVPYALAGHYQLWLWMITATAVALGGTVFAARIAYRLVGGNELRLDPDPIRRYAPWVAAFIAGAGVLGIEDYFHYILSSQSDPMIVTFLLAAIDMVLIGRYRWALVFGVLAALGTARGVAVPGPVRALGLVQDPEHAVDADPRRCRGPVHVVRGPDHHQRAAGHRRPARAGISARASLEPPRRDARPGPRDPVPPGVDRGGDRGRARAAAPQLGGAGPGRLGGRMGDRRDRLRLPRLAGTAALRVRGGRSRRGPGRRRCRLADARGDADRS